MMNHPYAKKIPRHHPQVQDRTMSVDGFTDFAYKAFDPKYEKSAAPLSKRRNGIGPTRHQLGTVIMPGDSAYAFRLLQAAGGLMALSIASPKIAKGTQKAVDTTKAMVYRANKRGVFTAVAVGLLLLKSR
jgi:hypothetical protein